MLISFCQVGHEQFEQAAAGGGPGGPGGPFEGFRNPFEDIFRGGVGMNDVCSSPWLEHLVCCCFNFSHHLSSFLK